MVSNTMGKAYFSCRIGIMLYFKFSDVVAPPFAGCCKMGFKAELLFVAVVVNIYCFF